MQPVAVITGASSGIGAATAIRLAGAGYQAILAARRADRIDELAAQIRGDGGQADTAVLDVTDRPAVDAFAARLDRCDVLVNNAGGAFGGETVAEGDPADWQAMFDVNVLGTLHVTQALLPKLIASGGGTIVVMSSTAGFVAYEGGGGYVAAKHAEHAIAGTLRLELYDQPVRVIEIAPGMVRTDEFAVKRYRGDAEKAAAVYAGVPEPLTADDVADTSPGPSPAPHTSTWTSWSSVPGPRPPSTRSTANPPNPTVLPPRSGRPAQPLGAPAPGHDPVLHGGRDGDRGDTGPWCRPPSPTGPGQATRARNCQPQGLGGQPPGPVPVARHARHDRPASGHDPAPANPLAARIGASRRHSRQGSGALMRARTASPWLRSARSVDDRRR